MAIASCLVDTNILLRITRRTDPQHKVVDTALARLAGQGAALYYTHQNIAELWNAMTRPIARNGLGLTVAEAEREVHAIESGLRSRFFVLCFCVDNLGVSIVAREAALFGGELQGFFAVELRLADEFFDAVGEALRGIGVRARVGGSFGGDEERDFSSGGTFGERSGEFREFAAAKFFVQLGGFARHPGAAVSKPFPPPSHTLRDPRRPS